MKSALGKFLVFCITVFAATAALGKELTLYTSNSIPPYVIENEDRGLAVDIVRRALSLKGYTVKFVVAPNKRVEQALRDRLCDGAYNLPRLDFPQVFYSEPVLIYQDVVVTLAKNHFKIQQVSDLQGRTVVAYQNAAKFLGTDFGALAVNNPRYSEVANQRSQIDMLYVENRADAIILERNIFSYYLTRSDVAKMSKAEYALHTIFAPYPIYAGFTSEKVRDDFSAGLKLIQGTGEYDTILQSYKKPQ